MGLDGGELDVHDLADLRVALVGAEQPEDLHLRGRKRVLWGQPRLQKAGIIGRLRPYIRHQPLVPLDAALPFQLLQQGQDRRAVDADRADKAKLRRRVQPMGEVLPPGLVPAAEARDGGEQVQMDAVDMPAAALDVAGQGASVRSALSGAPSVSSTMA